MGDVRAATCSSAVCLSKYTFKDAVCNSNKPQMSYDDLMQALAKFCDEYAQLEPAVIRNRGEFFIVHADVLFDGAMRQLLIELLE